MKVVVLALLTIGVSVFLPVSLRLAFFALLLSFAGGVYVGFGVADKDQHRLQYVQWTVALSFVGWALGSFQLGEAFLAVGWILHAGWDALHHYSVVKTKVVSWYPPFCLIFDLVIAFYLLVVAFVG